MKTWQSIIVFVLIFALVFIWRRNTAHAPTHQAPPGFPQPTEEEKATLPGTEPGITLARGALVVEGDVVDPIQEIRLARVQKPEEKIAFEAEVKSAAKFIGFFHVVSGEHYFVEVKTKFRTIVRDVAQPEKVQPLEIRRIPIHVKATNTGKPNIVFSPDGTLVAISTDSGELKLVEVFSGKERINKRISPGAQSLAFSEDGTRLVTLECGAKTIVHCYETAIEGEVWNKDLGNDVEAKGQQFRNVSVFGDRILAVFDNGPGTHWEFARLELRTGAVVSRSENSQLLNKGIICDTLGLGVRFASAGNKHIFLATESEQDLSGRFVALDATDTLPALDNKFTHNDAWTTCTCTGAAEHGNCLLVGMSNGHLYCLRINEPDQLTPMQLLKRWEVDAAGTIDKSQGVCVAISACGLNDRACFVTGPSSFPWDTTNPDVCAVNILALADGRKLTKLAVADTPRSCMSSSDGLWLVLTSAVGPPNAGEKQKLSLFDCSSLDRSSPPRSVYTIPMKDLGTTFSPDGRMLTVIIDSETASDPKSDEKTLDVVIVH
jgi:WD40 repeat protein